MIFASNKWGFGNWREVRIGIKKEDSFEFDSYFKSRTESELNKRMASLLRVIKAEQDYEARLQYYKKQEEGVLSESTNGKSKARLSGIIEVEDDNHSFIEDVEIENVSDAQDSGIKVSSKENYKKKKKNFEMFVQGNSAFVCEMMCAMFRSRSSIFLPMSSTKDKRFFFSDEKGRKKLD